MLVIGESLHRQRYKFLWDLFSTAISTATTFGESGKDGGVETDIPSDKLILELLRHQPVALLLDEFQTWYDGLTNSKQNPWKSWAFNFVQIFPRLLKSIPTSSSWWSPFGVEHRCLSAGPPSNPVQVDFKAGGTRERAADRRRMLLHRLFENGYRSRSMTSKLIGRTTSLNTSGCSMAASE